MYSLMNGRNTRKTQMYSPMHNSFANYCAEALQKSEMKLDYENELFLNNLHLIPDPLMKNLADTLITAENPEKVKKKSLNTPIIPPETKEVARDSTFFGITNFFSGVFSMFSGGMFRTRSQYDCFDDSRQGSPQSWHGANDVKDKNGQAPDKSSSESNLNGDMNNCKTVSSCEEKINKVRYLLTPNKTTNTNWRKRPKKVFVEPSSVEDCFEDAFSPEDFVSISNDPYTEYYCPPQHQNEDMCEALAPNTRIQTAPVKETAEIVKEVIMSESTNMKTNCDLKPDEDTTKPATDTMKPFTESMKTVNDTTKPVTETTKPITVTMKSATDTTNQNTEDSDDKHELVSSCEDKLSKLKDLLKVKTCKIMEPSPEPVTVQPKPAKTIPINKPVDKHFKNPHRMLDKRQKMKTKRNIQDDVNFANEINISPVSPSNNSSTSLSDYIDNSPMASPSTPSTINSSSSLGDYFDELKGRFRSASTTESEDSFQIVFKDSPKHDHKVFNNPKREHKVSDCESEDSFIVFEDTDNCYTSNDVFGDSDSDVSDSGCSTMTCKLSHSLSRTVSNLTDDTLYESSDEVDCAKVEPKVEARGMLLDAERKNLRKDLPMKKVHFSEEPPTVRVMRVWAFAARQARAGHWERFALDRDRFKRRIADVDMAVSWVLKPQHRSRVMFQRFMPLWNRQKRQEIAEKKERIAEEKRAEAARLEEEKRAEEVRLEEERIEKERLAALKEEESKNMNKAMENLRKFSKKSHKKERNKINVDSKKIKPKDVKVTKVTEHNNNSSEFGQDFKGDNEKNINESNELVKTVTNDGET